MYPVHRQWLVVTPSHHWAEWVKIGEQMSIKSRLKELFHIHKFTTLLIYPPSQDIIHYDFLLRCDCGYTKTTKMPYKSIVEFYEVKSSGVK
jgi:hypothetical protein